MLPKFQNEPLTDFSIEANRTAFAEALRTVERRLPIVGKNLIGGKKTGSARDVRIGQPLRPEAGHRPFPVRHDRGRRARPRRRDEGLSGLERACPPRERVALVLRISSILRRRKHEFSAMMVLEESKSWAEADGDTAEAIDFCEFYARDAERLAAPQPLTPFPGERNEFDFIPLGVCAVIPPWNFPLAILTGMTTAALVTGNTVVLKPSSDAAGIATMFREACEEAGVPGRRAELRDGRRRDGRQRARREPEDAADRLHRLARRRASRSPRRRARSSRGRSGSSAPSSRWAARTSSWSTRRPTSRRPPRASSPRPSASRGRSAPPARA